jgi:hypothetical protein
VLAWGASHPLHQQEVVELLSQKQRLVGGELVQHPLAGLILDLELVRAAVASRG